MHAQHELLQGFPLHKLGNTQLPYTLIMSTPTKKNAHTMTNCGILESLHGLLCWILLAEFRGWSCLLSLAPNVRWGRYLLEVGEETISFWS